MTSHSGNSAPRSDTLEVYLLGPVDFDSALFLQERAHYEVSGRDDRQGVLFLCEHPPTMTIGREGSRAHWNVDPHEFSSRLIPTRWLNRGGGCRMHSPGQLAAYPVLPLDRLECGLDDFRRRLEQSIIDMCGDLRVPAWQCKLGAGVAGRLGRFATIGAAVKRGVSHHGMFIDVAPDMDLIRLVSNGPGAERATCLSALRQRAVSMHAVREGLIRHLASQFGYKNYHIYSSHSLLKRSRKVVHVPA
ncbi:lipoyl(octanoyl) transferase LipB [Calycomorphotria hydatis]|nr:hypothetical protein [Calycomorphotria hydatis]